MVLKERVKIQNLKSIHHKAFVAAVAISSLAAFASVEIYIMAIVLGCFIQMDETGRKQYLAGHIYTRKFKNTLVSHCQTMNAP